MNKYAPPFEITNKMLDLVASIMKKIGKLDNYKDLIVFTLFILHLQ